MKSRSALPGRPSWVGRGVPSKTDRSQRWHPRRPVSRQVRSRTKRLGHLHCSVETGFVGSLFSLIERGVRTVRAAYEASVKPSPAHVAYLDGHPIGWCAVEPRTQYGEEEFAGLARAAGGSAAA